MVDVWDKGTWVVLGNRASFALTLFGYGNFDERLYCLGELLLLLLFFLQARRRRKNYTS